MRSHPDLERRTPCTFSAASSALSKASVAFVLLVPLVVLLGWQFNIPLLKSGYPGSPSTMKVNTALCFLLAGLALGLWQLEPKLKTTRLKKRLELLSTGFALGIALIGLLTLSQYLFGWQLGLDEWLFQDTVPSATTLYPGRMGRNTAFNFVLVGSALCLLRRNTRSSLWLAQSLSYLIYFIALLPLMGHLFGINPTYRFITQITTMAAPTAVLFIVLCLGLLLARPNQGWMGTITSQLAGGIMARSLLSWAMLIPLIVNWLTFQGERASLYDAAFGYAGRIVVISTAFSSLIWRNARLLNQQEQHKQQFEQQLEASEQQLASANASLEQQVVERTVELVQANDRLQRELFARTLAEEKLQELATLQQAILDGANYMIISTTTDGTITTFNAAAQKSLGYAASELIGIATPATIHDPEEVMHYAQVLSQEFGSPVIPGFDTFVTKARCGSADVREWSYIRKDGSRFPILLSVTALHDSEGEITGFLGIGMDISDRKRLEAEREQAEIALRKSEARFQAFMDNSPAASWITDIDGRFVYLSQTYTQMFALPRNDLVGRSIFELYDDAIAQQFLRNIQNVANSQQSVEVVELAPCPDGTIGDFLVYKFPINDHSGQTLVGGIAIDITARRQAEEALFHREQEFRTLAENSPDIISRFDRDLRYVYVSPAVELATGIPPHVFLGQTHQALGFPHEHSQLLDRCVQQVFATGKVDLIDLSFPTPHGLKYYQSRVVPELGRAGAIETVLVTSRDITEAKQAETELKQLMLELERSNQELQSFACIASHDLKEPLRTTRNFCSLLQAKYKGVLDDRGQDYIERIQKATQRMQTLIDDLLALSRVTTEAKPFVPVALAHIMDDVRASLGMQLQQTSGTIVVGELPIVSGDPTQLTQLFQNLISNALKFHGEAAPIVTIHSPTTYSPMTTQPECEHTYKILIEDNGIGFEAQYCDRIFGAFERLHGRNEFEGTGMGLALCRKIVERHGGSIVAQSVLGLGSTFILTLPRH